MVRPPSNRDLEKRVTYWWRALCGARRRDDWRHELNCERAMNGYLDVLAERYREPPHAAWRWRPTLRI